MHSPPAMGNPSMLKHGKFVLLRSGKGVIVETKDGNASVVIHTGRRVSWWEYLLKNYDYVATTIFQYSGVDSMAAFHVAANNFDDEALTKLMQQAWEETPDEADDAGLRAISLLLDGTRE